MCLMSLLTTRVSYVPQISGAISSEFLSGPSLAIVGFGLDELERLGLPGA
jgi:hypothetical protein